MCGNTTIFHQPWLHWTSWCGVRELVARRDNIGVYRAFRDPSAPVANALTVYLAARTAVSQRTNRSTEVSAL